MREGMIINKKFMEFEEVLEKRRSIRKFKQKEIPDKKIREILQLAQLAPSAGNLQAYKVKVIKEGEVKKKISDGTFMTKIKGVTQEWIFAAPAIFAICADVKESEAGYKERGRDLYAIQDATIFTAYLQLAIVSAGLASTWVGSFHEEDLKKSLNLPESLKIVALIPFGYPDAEPAPRERKKLDKILMD